jgi:hypothetical protein
MNKLSMVPFSALLTLAILSPACDRGASGPTSATPTAPTPPAGVTYTLSGAISEMTATGAVPIEGARIAEMGSGRFAVTGANGLYSIPGFSPTSRFILVTKWGYETETRTVSISGDTQLDIRLDRVASYILSGVVFEITAAGRVPIEGVDVYCDSCGSPVGHTFVYTDANGFYRLAWSMNRAHPLFVRKAGYEISDPTGKLRDADGRITAHVDGDTRFDIELARR